MIEAPYKGLTPYSEDDFPIFFGREEEREKIVANLIASRLTVLYGSSGVGKTSVLNAGVIPYMKSLARQEQQYNFVVVAFRTWQKEPLTSLEQAIRDSIKAQKKKEVRQADPRKFVEALRRWTLAINGDILIILDQFEEYLQYHLDEDGRGTFAEEFPRALNEADLRVNFLISIREDWYAKLDIFKGRVPMLFDNYLRIEPLDREAARSAVKKPLEVYSKATQEKDPWQIDEELTEEILEKVKLNDWNSGNDKYKTGSASSDTRIQTPYLQLVMLRLWEAERETGSHHLRLKTLEKLGGASDIVQNHVNTLMATLKPLEQEMASRFFNYLVTPSGIKQAHISSDLARIAGRKPSDPNFKRLLRTLSTTGTGILSQVPPLRSGDKEEWFEITHDVLANAILNWRERREQEREKCEKEKELSEQIRMAALSYSRELAQTAISELNYDPERSILIALYAVTTTDSPTPAAEDALYRAYLASHVRLRLSAHTARVWAVTFNVSGTLIATGSGDGIANIWNASSGELLLSLKHLSGVRDVAFSRDMDGAMLAIACEDSKVSLWQPFSEDNNARTLDYSRCSGSVEFSSDGKHLVTAGRDGEVVIWDALTLKKLRTLVGHQGPVWRAAFDASGARLATAGEDGTARLWDTLSGEELLKVSAHAMGLTDIAFSPADERFATAGKDNTAKLWDFSGKCINTLSGHHHWVSSVAFSPDGTQLATASTDHAAKVWDTRSGQVLLTLSGHPKGVTKIAFSPNGSFVATASEDHTARVWDIIPTSPELLTLRSHSDRVISINFSPDSKRIATASADKTVKLWDVASGKETSVILRHCSDVTGVAFSPDGNHLVTTSWDGMVSFWDADSGKRLLDAQQSRPLLGVAFSPDGSRIVIASTDYTARVLDSRSGEELLVLKGHAAYVNSVAFSPNKKRKLIATASDDNKVKLWDAVSGKEIRTFSGNEWFHGVAFNPDGSHLAAGSHDNKVRVWEISSGREVHILSGHTDLILDVAFSPDGARLATASTDRTVRVWELDSGAEVFVIPDHADQVWSVSFSPDGKLLATAGWDGTVRLWEAATGQPLRILSNESNRFTMVYSPDGMAKLYRINTPELVDMAWRRVTRPLTLDECKRFLHLEECPQGFRSASVF